MLQRLQKQPYGTLPNLSNLMEHFSQGEKGGCIKEKISNHKLRIPNKSQISNPNDRNL